MENGKNIFDMHARFSKIAKKKFFFILVQTIFLTIPCVRFSITSLVCNHIFWYNEWKIFLCLTQLLYPIVVIAKRTKFVNLIQIQFNPNDNCKRGLSQQRRACYGYKPIF